MSRKCSKSRGPSDDSAIRRCSSAVKPEVTKSCGAPASSMVLMPPKRAPVSARARNAVFSAAVGSRSVIRSPPSARRPPAGDSVPDRGPGDSVRVRYCASTSP